MNVAQVDKALSGKIICEMIYVITDKWNYDLVDKYALSDTDRGE